MQFFQFLIYAGTILSINFIERCHIILTLVYCFQYQCYVMLRQERPIRIQRDNLVLVKMSQVFFDKYPQLLREKPRATPQTSRCFPWICIAKQCKSSGTIEYSMYFPKTRRQENISRQRRTSLTYRLNQLFRSVSLYSFLHPQNMLTLQ